jgi:hypothetical protein
LKILQDHEKAGYIKSMREWVYQNAAALLGFDRIAGAVARRLAPQFRTASPERLTAAFRDAPAKSWRAVVEAGIAGGIGQHEAGMIDALERQLQQRVAAFSKKTPRQ